MKRYSLSFRAQSDLQEIWDYTDDNWGRAQAKAYLKSIEAAMERVASNPKLGKACEEIRSGYARYPVGSHILFYSITAGQVTVIRILHQRMDFVRHF
jgi:toxin ParE1/3/4